VWDVKEHNCLQTISPKFPSVQTGRIPDHGEFPLCLHQSATADLLILNCNDCVALYKLGKVEPEAQLPTTHSAPLSGVAYNPLFRQVATTSDDSSISIWDVDTGVRSLMQTDAHGTEEITCVAFDDKNRRLFTGARDGSVKVWNFQNGNCLHELEAVGEAEVTGVSSFRENTVIAVGWSRKIVLYDDSDADLVSKKALLNWKGGQLHEDDILSFALTKSPNLMATGSYDGKIIVWNDETQQVFLQLRAGRSNKKEKSKENVVAASIDVLHFLTERLRHEPLGRAVLISCESGVVHWWCLYGRVGSIGRFRASDDEKVTVLSLTTTHDDRHLITGDTSGQIVVWNIENYCVADSLSVTTEKPPIEFTWRAHEGAIIKIEFIDHEYATVVVTASTDKTARLWTLDGKLVGTFGQRKKWDLKKPKSYCHPLDPWGERVAGADESGEKGEDEVEETNDKKNTAIETEEKQTAEVDVMDRETKSSRDDTNYEDRKSSDSYDDDNDGSSSTSSKSSRDPPVHLPKPSAEVSPTKKDKPAEDKTEMGESVNTDADLVPGKILGILAEETLTRRTTARQERRGRVGYIDNNITARFGNICSPFQALTIKETEEISFEHSMPMTRRMMEKGMKCKNEGDLIKMPLKTLLNDFQQSEETSRGTTGQRKRHSQAGIQRRNNNHNNSNRLAASAQSSFTSTPRPFTGETATEERQRSENNSTPLSGFI